MKHGRIIDAKGYYVEDVVVEEDQELPPEAVAIPVSQDAGFHRPRWNRDTAAWEEGETPEVVTQTESETASTQTQLDEELTWLVQISQLPPTFQSREEVALAISRMAKLMLFYAAPYLVPGQGGSGSVGPPIPRGRR